MCVRGSVCVCDCVCIWECVCEWAAAQIFQLNFTIKWPISVTLLDWALLGLFPDTLVFWNTFFFCSSNGTRALRDEFWQLCVSLLHSFVAQFLYPESSVKLCHANIIALCSYDSSV